MTTLFSRIKYTCVLLLCAVGLSAQTLSDSAQISLLTCTPGYYVYSQYGHSAIRVLDPVEEIDVCFNYGLFDFNTEDFYLKFVRGETDYQLGIEPTQRFLVSSAYIGRTTYEQPLNLTQAQKQSIFDALMVNYRPENRVYRYNFVFDNCATRPYHLLKKALGEELDARCSILDTRCSMLDAGQTTYRTLISHYSQANAWEDFGVNIIFGKDADKVMTTEERLFLPEELMRYVGQITLADGTPLTYAEEVAPFEIASTPWFLSPNCLLILLVVVGVLLTYFDLRKRRISWWFDAILFGLYALLGTIAFYLTFFSLHPLVGENYNILFFSPLMFVPFVCLLFKKGREWLQKGGLVISIYFYIALIVRLVCGQAWHWVLILPILHYIRLRLVWYREVFLLCGQRPRHKSYAGQRIKLLIALLVVASSAFASPRLTVVICVNGLNDNALSDLRTFMPAGGLRTIDEEAYESNVSFPQMVYGGSETLATLVTGTTPATHGISANYYYDRDSRSIQSLFQDKSVTGIGTDSTLAATSLLAPALADEFRMAHPHKDSKIYAVGISPENTILLAGHAANACAWIHPKALRWVSTSYYQEGLPTAADQFNMSQQLSTIANNTWVPEMELSMYVNPSKREKIEKGFKYAVKDVFTQSPAANRAVIELALALQQSKNLGRDQEADLLSLELTVVSPKAQTDLLRSAEQEEMYLSLNRNLGYFIQQLTKQVGKENLRIVLFGKPVHGNGVRAYSDANLPTNYFNIDRAAALINTYLMALYGHERWIDGGYMQSIYLNRTLIEQRRLSLYEFQQQVSQFLLEFEGTQAAMPAQHLWQVSDAPNSKLNLLNNTFNKRCFGDVVFTLQPMWLLGESDKKRQDSVIEPHPTSPFFIWTTERINLPDQKLSATEVKDFILQ